MNPGDTDLLGDWYSPSWGHASSAPQRIAASCCPSVWVQGKRIITTIKESLMRWPVRGKQVPRAPASSRMASSFQAGALIKRLQWFISLAVTVGIAWDNKNPSTLILLVTATLNLKGWLKGNSLSKLCSILVHYQLSWNMSAEWETECMYYLF